MNIITPLSPLSYYGSDLLVYTNTKILYRDGDGLELSYTCDRHFLIRLYFGLTQLQLLVEGTLIIIL